MSLGQFRPNTTTTTTATTNNNQHYTQNLPLTPNSYIPLSLPTNHPLFISIYSTSQRKSSCILNPELPHRMPTTPLNAAAAAAAATHFKQQQMLDSMHDDALVCWYILLIYVACFAEIEIVYTYIRCYTKF